MPNLHCPKCKSEISKSDYVCPKCGFALSGELIYVEYEDGYAIAGPKDKGIRLAKIESEFNGKQVTAILENAFMGCVKLTSVLIPNSIKLIGGHAFDGCVKLDTAVIPESVVEIGDYAYFGCTKLSDLTLGNGLTRVSGSATCYCRTITAMRYSSGLGSLEGGNFTCTCGALNFKNGLEIIGESAFASCPAIKTIYLPEGVKEIRHNAFGDCKSLSSATLPLSLERLEAPFDNSPKLKSIRFNGSKAKFKDSYKFGQPIKVACMDGILSVGE